jgi:tryptophan-rich sensory protein
MSSKDGQELPQRPPKQIFGIVWPILYLLIGYVWMNASTQLENVLLMFLNFLLGLWIVVWSCKGDKKNALYIIYGAITTTLALIKVSPNGVYLVPLAGWLLFASNLNWNSVNTT